MINFKKPIGLFVLIFVLSKSLFCQQFNNEDLYLKYGDTLNNTRKLPDYQKKSKNSKPYDPEAQLDSNRKVFSESVKNSEDKNEWAEIYTYNPVKINFSRFKNSPCYDDIGFHPMNLQSEEDVKSLEKFYEKCEAEKNTQLLLKFLFAAIFILILVVVIYYSIKRK
jgi:hypothetical protein